MASKETVAAIATVMRRMETVFGHLYWCEYANRLEAAHKRKLAAKDAEIEKLTFDIMTLKSEQRTAGEVIIEQTNRVEAKDAEIVKLRELLKEAVASEYGRCRSR